MTEPKRTEQAQEHYYVLMFDQSYGEPHKPRYAMKNKVPHDRYRPLGSWNGSETLRGAERYEDLARLSRAAQGFLKSEYATSRRIKVVHYIEIKTTLVTTETTLKQYFKPGMDVVEKIAQIPTPESEPQGTW